MTVRFAVLAAKPLDDHAAEPRDAHDRLSGFFEWLESSGRPIDALTVEQLPDLVTEFLKQRTEKKASAPKLSRVGANRLLDVQAELDQLKCFRDADHRQRHDVSLAVLSRLAPRVVALRAPSSTAGEQVDRARRASGAIDSEDAWTLFGAWLKERGLQGASMDVDRLLALAEQFVAELRAGKIDASRSGAAVALSGPGRNPHERRLAGLPLHPATPFHERHECASRLAEIIGR